VTEIKLSAEFLLAYWMVSAINPIWAEEVVSEEGWNDRKMRKRSRRSGATEIAHTRNDKALNNQGFVV
jgi:hypothetical protein